MIYIRGNARDFDRWRAYGLDGWGYADVLPYFKRSEGAPHRDRRYHGHSGPLRTSTAGSFERITQRFVEAAQQAGAPLNPDFNGASQLGVGRFDTKVWRGQRQSASAAYLANPPANLSIATRTSNDGPGAEPFWSTTLFHALRDTGLPELQVFFTPMVVREEAGGTGWSLSNLVSLGRTVLARGKTAVPGIQLDVNLLQPRSCGTLRLRSADPAAAPLIDPAYFQDEEDVDDLVAGVRHMREIAGQDALKGLLAAELSPGIGVSDDKALARAVRDLATTGHHPVSTCRMGGDKDPDAVLDAALRVRGVDGLRVVAPFTNWTVTP